MTIEVLINKSPYSRLPQRKQLARAVDSIANDFGWRNGQVSIALVDDPTIQELNRQYLKHDYPTDVISFNLTDDEQTLEGEVIVSWQTAERVALENNWQTSLEILLYVVHGMLHIMGLDDSTPEQAHQMRQKERHYMLLIAGDAQNCS
jgi:probable rRNA maturation factor